MADAPHHQHTEILDAQRPTLHLLYQENSKVAATFIDWRHKVILLCSVMVTIVLGIASWMYKQHLGGFAISVPFALGSATAVICRIFDKRNGQFLDVCFTVGSDLERRLTQPDLETSAPPGIYTHIQHIRQHVMPFAPNKGTYGHTLRRAYLALAIILGACSIAAVAVAIVGPDLLIPTNRP